MKDKRQHFLDIVRPHLTEHRYTHTIGVLQTAVSLCAQYGGDQEVIETAAILHDIAKFWSGERLKESIIHYKLKQDLLDYDKETWHGPVGAEYVKTVLGITDDRILNCIRNHTVGNVHMSTEEKIIWLADYIEPGRHFPGVDEVRELAQQDLNAALLCAFDRTILFLLKQRKKVYPDTFLARNGLLDNIKI